VCGLALARARDRDPAGDEKAGAGFVGVRRTKGDLRHISFPASLMSYRRAGNDLLLPWPANDTLRPWRSE
jgi:hypothetical protein